MCTFDNEGVVGSEKVDARKPLNHVILVTSVFATDCLVGQQKLFFLNVTVMLSCLFYILCFTFYGLFVILIWGGGRGLVKAFGSETCSRPFDFRSCNMTEILFKLRTIPKTAQPTQS